MEVKLDEGGRVKMELLVFSTIVAPFKLGVIVVVPFGRRVVVGFVEIGLIIVVSLGSGIKVFVPSAPVVRTVVPLKPGVTIKVSFGILVTVVVPFVDG
jgi:hypothetical protein